MEFFDREVRNLEGAVLEIMGAISVQTGQFMERRKAEETLRLSEERFRATFEQAAVGVAHVGTAGRWLRVKPEALRDLGVRARGALGEDLRSLTHPDDLGGQGASLSLPRRLPVDFLKIDRSVIDGLGRNPEDSAVTSAFVGLAEAFGVGVIAEGVENADQILRFREMGCKLGQGYHFSPPVPGLDALWLRSGLGEA